MAIKISSAQVGGLQNNCYLLQDEATKEAFLVDPGDDFDRIKAMVEGQDAAVKGVLITHIHFDHIGAAEKAVERWNCPIYVHPDELAASRVQTVFSRSLHRFYEAFEAAWALTGRELNDGESLMLGDAEVKAIMVPGHSPNSLCYYIESSKLLAAGDTLFRGSIGREDFYINQGAGEAGDLARNIRDKLLGLPDDTVVLPGHGPATTIGREKEYNPYLEEE